MAAFIVPKHTDEPITQNVGSQRRLRAGGLQSCRPGPLTRRNYLRRRVQTGRG